MDSFENKLSRKGKSREISSKSNDKKPENINDFYRDAVEGHTEKEKTGLKDRLKKSLRRIDPTRPREIDYDKYEDKPRYDAGAMRDQSMQTYHDTIGDEYRTAHEPEE